MSSNSFHDASTPPTDDALEALIGRPFGTVTKALAGSGIDRKAIARAWKFSKTSGWYVTYDRGRQRLFYLFPNKGGFLLKIVFNETGVELIGKSDLPAEIKAAARTAKRYVEGALLEFSAPEITPEVLAGLLRIKAGSVRK